ncbi:MAG: cyclic pyranopterin monophosphate synthase MoaC [Vitreoscilla sp.]|nr:cyclic pyranopterin monophosphate synthase MoaC [Vitreoscilla sp.]
MANTLTHFDEHGQAHMVDVGHKAQTHRRAIASGKIILSVEAFACVQAGNSKKGDVLGVARIAAIQASKQTSTLIPLCHPLALSHVSVEFTLLAEESALVLTVTTETTGQTGVEMEALCAVNVGLLTVYDMLKAVDKSMCITDVCLQHKEGGKSGSWHHPTLSISNA